MIVIEGEYEEPKEQFLLEKTTYGNVITDTSYEYSNFFYGTYREMREQRKIFAKEMRKKGFKLNKYGYSYQRYEWWEKDNISFSILYEDKSVTRA